MLAARFNRAGHELIDHHTYAIASDGDMQEGVASEACSLAGHLGLGRLIAFYDDNHIQLAGDTSMAFTEDVGARYEAYGWHVQNLGEDLELEPLERRDRGGPGASTDRPSLIIVRTHIGYGSPNKQDTQKAHGSPLGEDEVRLTKEAYGWPTPTPHFLVPDEVAGALPRVRRARQARREAEWKERLERYRAAEHPSWRRSSTLIMRAPAARRLGRRPCRASSPDDGHDRHAQGLAAGDPVGGAARCRTWSAARPTSSPRRSP